MRGMSFLLLAATLAGCSTAPDQRSANAEANLEQALAGKVAHAAIDCLPSFRAGNMIAIDDNTILFREGRTIYRQDFGGASCNGVGSGHLTLVTNQQGRLCRGDPARVVDLQTGSTMGTCIMGDFIPYRSPGR